MTIAHLDARAAAAASDRVEAAAFADLFDAAPAVLRERLGLEVRKVAGATLLLAPRMPGPMFNRAIGWGMDLEGSGRAASIADADVIAQAFRDAGSASWWLHANPLAQPAGLADALLARGWTLPPRRSWAKMLRETSPPAGVDTALSVEPASAAGLEATTQAIAAAFEMPPFMGEWLAALHARPRWRVYALRDGAQVVGGACLFVDGPLAWLGMGAVLPSHRRRGGQRALMARRIADAIAAGAVAIATETGEPVADEPNPSLANMRRCGFEVVASRLNLVGPV